MTISRREFVSLISSAAAVLAAPGARAQALRIRKEIRALSAAEAGHYAAGVAAMKALPVANFRSWMYQAGVHGSPPGGDAGVPDAGTYWNQCVHGGTHFLSWHRWELLFLEEIVRLMSGQCTFTLPYWDYIADGFLPDPLRVPANASNPLYNATRSAALNGGTAALSGLNTAALNQTVFATFSSTLYGNPHSAVHGLIGGNMGSVPTAAQDPVFYLHHCNIDRYWECWLKMGGGRANPGSPWTEQTFPFRTLSGRRDAIVGDCGRTADLGYTYDNLPCGLTINPAILEWLRNMRFIRVRVRPPPPIPDPWPWATLLATETVVLNGQPTAFALPRRSLTAANLSQIPSAKAANVVVALTDVEMTKAARESGIFFEVWFAPGARALKSRGQEGVAQIGSFSSFDIPDRDAVHRAGSHHMPSAILLPLPPEAVRALVSGSEDPLVIFVRRGLVDRSGKPLEFDAGAELLRIGALRLEVGK